MSTEHAYGREGIVYITQESGAAYGTLVAPAAGDAIKVLKCDMGVTQERKDRLEKGTTRSIISRVKGRKTGTWSIDKYVLPSGVAGAKPDDALLWEALFGKEAVTQDTKVVYSLLAEPAMSLNIFQNAGHFREALSGVVPSKLSFKFSGDDEPKVTFSGECKDHYMCGSDALAQDATATATITVTDALRFCTGMLIKVGTEDNSGNGFLVNSIDYGNNQLSLNASVSSQSTGVAVVPLPLSATTAGEVIPVVVGSVKIGGSTIYVTGGGFDIDQKVKLRNEEFGTVSASGYRHPEFREVTCSLDLYFVKGAAKWLNDAKRFTAQDIELNFGETGGLRLEVDMNQTEFEIPKVDVPDSEECTISLVGKCLGNNGEDEIAVTFL